MLKVNKAIYYIIPYTLLLLLVLNLRDSELGAISDPYCKGIISFDDEGNEVPLADADQKSQSKVYFQAIFDLILNMRGENQLKKYVQEDDIDSYSTSFYYYSLTFIGLAALSGIFFVLQLFCCVCDSCCPPCSGCRRDQEKDPYKDCDLTCPAIVAIIFGSIILGCAILGFLKTNELGEGLNLAQCSSYSVLDELIYGNQNQTWIGFNGGITSFGFISIAFRNNINNIQATFSDQDWLDTDFFQLIQMNTQIFQDMQNQQLSKSPDPINPNIPVPSQYIQNLLGPDTLAGTMTFKIKQEFELKTKILIEQIKLMNQLALVTVASQVLIMKEMMSAIDTLGQTAQKVRELSDGLDKHWDAPQEYLSQLEMIQMYLFSVIGLVGLIAFLGSCGTHCGEAYGMRYMLYFGWFLSSPIAIIGLLVTAVSLPAAIGAVEACQTKNDFLSLEANMDLYANLVPTEIIDKLKVCQFGDGDMVAYLEMDDKFEIITKMFEAIALTQQKLDPSQNEEMSLANSVGVMVSEIALLKEYQKGLHADSTATDSSNPSKSIEEFTKYTDHSVSGSQQTTCTVSKDIWVYDESECTGTKFSVENESTYNLGDSICIQLNYMTPDRVQERYLSMKTECSSNYFNQVISYHSALYDFDQERRDFFGGIIEKVEELQLANDRFNQKIENFMGSVSTYQIQGEPLQQLIADINNDLNCINIQKSFVRMDEGVCVRFIYPLFFVMTSISIAGLSMFCSTCGSYFTATRYSKVAENKKKENAKEGDNKVHPVNQEEG